MANKKFRAEARKFLAYRASLGGAVAEPAIESRMKLRYEINPWLYRAQCEARQLPQTHFVQQTTRTGVWK